MTVTIQRTTATERPELKIAVSQIADNYFARVASHPEFGECWGATEADARRSMEIWLADNYSSVEVATAI